MFAQNAKQFAFRALHGSHTLFDVVKRFRFSNILNKFVAYLLITSMNWNDQVVLASVLQYKQTHSNL